MEKRFTVKFFLLLTAVLLAVVPAGCTKKTAESEVKGKITLVDQMDREVTINGEIKRIVSLSPQHTEILFALGLGERVVGVTDFCNYPPEVERIEKVGGFTDASIEVVLTRSPDLVLAGSPHKEIVSLLEERNIPVLVMEPVSVEQVYNSILLVGTATGAEKEAKTLVAEIKQQVDGVQRKLALLDEEEKIPVYYELWYDPPMSIGNRSFIHEVISLAGGKNIFADLDDNYPTVSAEVIAQENPRVILYSDDHGTVEAVREQYSLRPGWDKMSAMLENRIHGVDGDLFNRAGPRVGLAVEEAAGLFYPELFGNY